MKLYKKPMRSHIDTLTSIYDRFARELTVNEIQSLNVAIQVLDTLERDNGVIILKQEKKQ